MLLADDDPAIRTVLTQFLMKEGYEVRATDSGLTLYDWARRMAAAMVVCDVMMPDSDGLDLLPKIRAARPDLPVIIMSAKNNVLTALRASERGRLNTCPSPLTFQIWAMRWLRP